MEPSVFSIEAKVEEMHWWFAGRKKLIQKLINERNVSRDVSVMDAGTGSGSNLRLLKKLGFVNVTGVDSNEHAIRWCAQKGLGKVEHEDICELSFANERFQLILATDILEHVDDEKALKEIFRVLSPKGTVFFTVPAFQMLWGLQDDVSHHRRRYTKHHIELALKNAGFQITQSFHFNYILFAPIWFARQVIRLLDIKLESENQVNTPIINFILTKLFSFDVHTAPWLNPPFGVSILVEAQKP